MSFLSKVKNAARVAVRTTAKVANAPTSIATRAISKVAPAPIGRLVRAAGNLTPQAIVARKVLSMSSARSAPKAAAAIARTPPGQTRAALCVGIFCGPVPPATAAAMRAYEAAHPGSKLESDGRDTRGWVVRDRTTGQRLTEADFRAVVGTDPSSATAQQAVKRADEMRRMSAAAPPPTAPDDAGDGAPPDYSGGDVDPYGQDSGEPTSPPADDDPTVELPDGYLSPGADDGAPGADMAGIDYHQALEGLGDWTTDLANFGKAAAINVGKQALTTIGGKLTAASKPVVPVPPPSIFASPVVKVALGAGALAAVYLLVSRRGSAPAAPAPAA